jgi:Mor family transcriptional regulator
VLPLTPRKKERGVIPWAVYPGADACSEWPWTPFQLLDIPTVATARGSYANAREILPGHILKILQDHFEGGLLWVPTQGGRREKTQDHLRRNRDILEDKERGIGTKELALKYGLSQERIRQILRKAKSVN